MTKDKINWEFLAKQYEFQLSVLKKERDYYKNSYLTLLDAMANPEKYEE